MTDPSIDQTSSHLAPQLTQLQIKEGVWEGILSGLVKGSAVPNLTVTCGDIPPWPAEVSPLEQGEWMVRIEIPSRCINEGPALFVISASGTDGSLASFIVAAGSRVADDWPCEVKLLRSELEVLKRAFRHHCRTVGLE